MEKVRKAEHIKKHIRETKRGNRLSKNRGSDFRKDDKYRAKNGSGKKTLHFTVQKVVSADNKSSIAAWLKYSLWIGQHNFPAFLTSFLV